MRRTDLRQLLAVAAGGALGTWGRWWATTTWPQPLDRFPATTFAVNVLGALLLGLLVAVLFEGRPERTGVRAFLATGVLGAFTTFSTLAVEVVVLVESGRLWVAGAYLALSLVVGVVAAAAGLVVGRRLVGGR